MDEGVSGADRQQVASDRSPLTTFAHVSGVQPAEVPGRYLADVHAEWSIGGKANGGYLVATMARAVVASVAHEHVIAASAHFLHSPDAGSVVIDVEVLRTGRSADQVRARLGQDERVCIEALFTVATLDPGEQPYWGRGLPDGELTDAERVAAWPRPSEVARVPSTGPLGLRVAIFDQVDMRMDAATSGFARGQLTGRGELSGWLTLPADEPFDPVSLLYAVDGFPPATLDVELTGWVPTLELTGYVRAIPAPGPVRVLHRAQLIDAQRVDEQCWVWDSRGRLVAQGTQLAGIRLG